MPITEEQYLNWDFDETFTEYLQERWLAKQRARKIGQYYPSTLWRCLREEILTWDMAVMPNPESLRNFFGGDLYQEEIIDKIIKWKFGNDYTEIEQRICISVALTPEENEFIFIRGRIDELTFIKVGDNLVAIPNEAKTQKKGLEYLKGPREYHVYQLMAYLGAIGAPYGKLIYMDRSTLFSKTFLIKFDIKIYKKILDRARLYHYYVMKRGNSIPPAENIINKKEWLCKSCPVRDFCFKKEGKTK